MISGLGAWIIFTGSFRGGVFFFRACAMTDPLRGPLLTFSHFNNVSWGLRFFHHIPRFFSPDVHQADPVIDSSFFRCPPPKVRPEAFFSTRVFDHPNCFLLAARALHHFAPLCIRKHLQWDGRPVSFPPPDEFF